MLRWSSLLLLLTLWSALAASGFAAASCPAEAASTSESALAVEPGAADASTGSNVEPALNTLPKDVGASASRAAARPAPRARWHRFLPGMFK